MPVDENQQPGMATPDELQQLDTATGNELDDLFTRLMIRHHAGGAHMAEYTIEHASIDRIRDLAQTMLNGQRSEVIELNRWRVQNGYDTVDTRDLHAATATATARFQMLIARSRLRRARVAQGEQA